MCTFKTQGWNRHRMNILIPKGRNGKDKRSNRFKVSLKLNRQITLNPVLLGSMSHLTDPHILDTLRQELVPQISSHPICIVLLSGAHSATPPAGIALCCTQAALGWEGGPSATAGWDYPRGNPVPWPCPCSSPVSGLQAHGSRRLYPSKSRWKQPKCWCLLDAAKAAPWPTGMIEEHGAKCGLELKM